jgi:succinate dehydrogenase / fumarate reductase membrane anchor subunit
MSYKTDYARARGNGSAHEGTHHFWIQRVTAIALIPLTLFFIFPFINALGNGYDEVHRIYQNPWNAFIAVNFIAIGFWHLKLGLQVIIEDYVGGRSRRLKATLANIIFNWSFAVAGIYAVAKIALSA